MVLVFLDLLGTKSKWHAAGRAGAEAAFNRFESVVTMALKDIAPGCIRAGGMESDSCAIIFTGAEPATLFAKKACHLAFRSARLRDDERMWLRGVMAPSEGDSALRIESALTSSLSQIRKFSYVAQMLDVIAVEKSGYKGMRFLLHNDLVGSALCKAFRIPIGSRYLIPFKALHNSTYPVRIAGAYQDFLWMASESIDEWDKNKLTMASRLRWSSNNQEEFVHAAATQVVFHECAAIISSLRYRSENES